MKRYSTSLIIREIHISNQKDRPYQIWGADVVDLEHLHTVAGATSLEDSLSDS